MTTNCEGLGEPLNSGDELALGRPELGGLRGGLFADEGAEAAADGAADDGAAGLHRLPGDAVLDAALALALHAAGDVDDEGDLLPGGVEPVELLRLLEQVTPGEKHGDGREEHERSGGCGSGHAAQFRERRRVVNPGKTRGELGRGRGRGRERERESGAGAEEKRRGWA